MSTPTLTPTEIVRKAEDFLTRIGASFRADGKLPSLNINELQRTRAEVLKLANQTIANKNATAEEEALADRAIAAANGLDGWVASCEARLGAMARKAGDRSECYTGMSAGPGFENLNPGFNGAGIDLAGNGKAISVRDFLAADRRDLDSGGFDSLGAFLGAVRNQRLGLRADERLAKYSASQIGDDLPGGGFLMPSLFQQQIIMSASSDEQWFNQVDQYIVPAGSGRSVVTPVLADRDQSGNDIGGLELARVAESATIPTSTLEFQSRTAKLNKCGTLVKVSNELLSDNAVGFTTTLNMLFGKSVARRRALDFIGGTGVGQPTGVLTAAALYTVAKEAGQAADTIVKKNVTKMYERLTPASRSRAIWLAHSGTFDTLTDISLPVGTSGNSLFLFDITSSPTMQLLGRPIYFTTAAKVLGDKGDILLVDPMAYRYIYKPIVIDLSTHVGFANDETWFKCVMRDDGAPIYAGTHTDDQSYENSEFIALEAR